MTRPNPLGGIPPVIVVEQGVRGTFVLDHAETPAVRGPRPLNRQRATLGLHVKNDLNGVDLIRPRRMEMS